MRDKGLTLMELIVVVAIIGLLVALLLPVFVQVRKRGYEPVCISNLRQLQIAFSNYCEDYGGAYPERQKYLRSYIRDMRILRCPADLVSEGSATNRDPFVPPQQWFRTSYYYVGDEFLPRREVREGDQVVDYLQKLREADPNHGIMVCLLHGELMGSTLVTPLSQMWGKVLRLRLDGSVQPTFPGFICYMRVDEGIPWGYRHPWLLFTDIRPVPEQAIAAFPLLDNALYRAVPCPPEYR